MCCASSLKTGSISLRRGMRLFRPEERLMLDRLTVAYLRDRATAIVEEKLSEAPLPFPKAAQPAGRYPVLALSPRQGVCNIPTLQVRRRYIQNPNQALNTLSSNRPSPQPVVLKPAANALIEMSISGTSASALASSPAALSKRQVFRMSTCWI